MDISLVKIVQHVKRVFVSLIIPVIIMEYVQSIIIIMMITTVVAIIVTTLVQTAMVNY